MFIVEKIDPEKHTNSALQHYIILIQNFWQIVFDILSLQKLSNGIEIIIMSPLFGPSRIW